MKIETIQVLLPCMVDGQPAFEPCQDVRDALRHEVRKLDEKLRDLGQSRRIVANFLKAVETDARV